MALSLLLGIVVIALVVAALAGTPAAGDPAPARVRRTVRGWRWAGLTVGVAAAAVAVRADPLGRGTAIAAPLLGLCVLAGVVAGETRAARPTGPARAAALETRQIRHYLPRWPATAVAVAGVGLAVLLVATTAAGSPDDQGRAGRSFGYDCGEFTGGHGPWPGSFYSLPLAVVLGAGVLLAGLALRRVVGRPRPVDDAGDLVRDDAERRRSGHAVTGAAGLLVAVPLIGVSVTAAGGLLASPCRPAWWTAAAWLLLLLTPGWLALAGWSVTALLRSGAPTPRPAVPAAR
ncbi:hypothetical protein [Micromonospora mirobrigensis]|uniref:Uncharacterized protein n=1 Tax=Micromonospora mirobrigensis TaxID=262898 RepID=A0A1C4UEA7_9ACTN|nr:hypothetical protein [Micromonospora mirobrigensis]SCE69992.1 hypothetical protein GA0070564_101415 [Micromonospora mirobrigensis]